MSHEVFISYSSKDSEVSGAVCAALEASGTACWIAPRDVVPGTPYGEALIDAINASQVMVLVLSEHSNQSQQVVREVERAISKGIPIIPFRIADVRLAKSLEYFLSTCHWLDATHGEVAAHIPRLTEAVNTALRQIFDGETLQLDPMLARPPQMRRRVAGGSTHPANTAPQQRSPLPQASANQQHAPYERPLLASVAPQQHNFASPTPVGMHGPNFPPPQYRSPQSGPSYGPQQMQRGGWQQGNPLPQVKPTNVIGIVGLMTSILGVLSCGTLSPLGLVISLAGLFKAPRGQAIAGSILGGLGSGVFIALFAYGFWGGFQTALELEEATSHIEAFAQERGELPDESTGNALIATHKDGWNNEFRYQRTTWGYEVRSAGLDGQFDTSDDHSVFR